MISISRMGGTKRHATGTRAASLSMPRLYCAHCGTRLRFNVVERGERLGIEPRVTHCPDCGSSVLADGETVTVWPKTC